MYLCMYSRPGYNPKRDFFFLDRLNDIHYIRVYARGLSIIVKRNRRSDGPQQPRRRLRRRRLDIIIIYYYYIWVREILSHNNRYYTDARTVIYLFFFFFTHLECILFKYLNSRRRTGCTYNIIDIIVIDILLP